MRYFRFAAAVLLLSVYVMAAAQLAPTAFAKFGANRQNTHKAGVNGPVNPALYLRWIGLGATEQPTYDGGLFWAAQGPQLRAFDPAFGIAYNVMNTTPGNVTPVTQIALTFNLKDESGEDIFCDDEVNSGNCTYGPIPAAAWSGYGTQYLMFGNPFALETIVLEFRSGSWRCVSPTVTTTLTIPDDEDDAALSVTGIVFVTLGGTVYMRYVNDRFDGDVHVFSWRNPWEALDPPVTAVATGMAMYTEASPALNTAGNRLYMADHYGTVTCVDLQNAVVFWQVFFEEAFDSHVTVLSNGDLLIPTTISFDMGREGNRLYKVPSSGNPLLVTSLDLDGSIVGGPAYNSSNSSAYVATLGNDGSTLYQINPTTMTVTASRSDLGQLRADPILDAAGNLYIGNEQGFLYSLDANLNIRPNWPVYVGAPIYTACSINDDGLLAVPTGTTFSIYGEAEKPVHIGGKPVKAQPRGR